MTGLLADPVNPPLIPGSPEWKREITASKVSAILGLSKYESRFGLYYKLAGQLDDEFTGNSATTRGTYLEPAIANWLSDELQLHFRPGGCWRNRKYPWMVASPDRLAYANPRSRRPLAVVEIKTAAEWDGWGRDGSDEIPPGYRAQVVFQMDTLGLKRAYVGVLLSRLRLQAHVIHYDSGEAEWIRDQVTEFLDTLPGGLNEAPPDIDDHDSTYEAVRRLHPLIEDREVEVDLDVAQRFVAAIRNSKAAQAVEQGAKSEMALLMGNAIRAILPRPGFEPLNIAVRTAKGSGVPYVTAKRPLPELDGIL